jgi:protein-S-isoprenylcysteine O-methyltransferase Ste14
MTFRAKGYALTCCSVTALAVAVVEDYGDVMPGSAIRNAPLPPGQIVGLAAVTILGRVVPVPLPGPRAAYRVFGAALGGTGVALTMWALRERGRHAAGRFDLERPESLVTSGPYALSRHPMYVGWWLIHLGTGLYRGSAWVLLSVPAATLAEHPAVLAEERRLVEAFGSDAENYLARIPRYLPRRVGSS